MFLPASLTPPCEEECKGVFRSFGPNCCMVRSAGQGPAAATQGGRKSKGWPQDRFSLGRGRAGETALAGLRRPCGLHCPFLGKRHRRETPRQGYTTATAHTRNHWNSFMLSLFTAQCMSVASCVHKCAVSDWCVCSRFKKEWLRRPSYKRTLPLCMLVGWHLDATCVSDHSGADVLRRTFL